MTITYADEYDVQARMRRRRRKLAGIRRERLSKGAHRIFLILSICIVTAVAGYIGVQDGQRSDTGLAYTAAAAEETVYVSVVVQQGDTLWGIASDHTDASKDIRKQIKAIRTLNDIQSGNIYPGQVIRVPQQI